MEYVHGQYKWSSKSKRPKYNSHNQYTKPIRSLTDDCTNQDIEHRSDRANEVAQNVNKNPNLRYLLDDPNSPYYTGGGTVDPNAPIQNADGTINSDQIIVIGPTSERVYYYHPDHLGSTAVVTNEDGTLHEQVEYFPFGETWVQNGGNDKVTPYLYTSKELDSETGLYYFGARYYDPRTSIWQSADPILGKYLPNLSDMLKAQENGKPYLPEKSLAGMGGVYAPANLALFTYGHLNPVKFSDPDGNVVWVPILVGIVLFSADVATNDPVPGHEQDAITPSMSGPDMFVGAPAKGAQSVGSLLRNLFTKGGENVAVRAAINPKIYTQLEKQLAKDGPKSIHKALESAQKTLQEHKDKLPDMKYKSAVEKTIKNVESQIETLKQFIKEHDL